MNKGKLFNLAQFVFWSFGVILIAAIFNYAYQYYWVSPRYWESVGRSNERVALTVRNLIVLYGPEKFALLSPEQIKKDYSNLGYNLNLAVFRDNEIVAHTTFYPMKVPVSAQKMHYSIGCSKSGADNCSIMLLEQPNAASRNVFTNYIKWTKNWFVNPRLNFSDKFNNTTWPFVAILFSTTLMALLVFCWYRDAYRKKLKVKELENEVKTKENEVDNLEQEITNREESIKEIKNVLGNAENEREQLRALLTDKESDLQKAKEQEQKLLKEEITLKEQLSQKNQPSGETFMDMVRCAVSSILQQPDGKEKRMKISLGDYIGQIHFDEDTGIFSVGNVTCSFLLAKKRKEMMSSMFRHQPGVYRECCDLYEEMTEEIFTDNVQGNIKMVRDTMNAVNRQIKEEIGTDDNLLGWQNKSVYRLF